MSVRFLMTAYLAALCLLAAAAYPQIEFIRTMGGADDDMAYSIVQGPNNGFAVAGATENFGNGGLDATMTTYDSAGVLQWVRTFGGVGNDNAEVIIRTADGGYAIAGYISSYGAGLADGFVRKFDKAWASQWAVTIGSAQNDYLYDLIQTSTGEYVVTGRSEVTGAGERKAFIVKISSTGNLLWARVMGEDEEVGQEVVEADDGGFVMAGVTSNYGAGLSDLYLTKFNNMGVHQWTKAMGGTNFESAASIVKCSDGGFALTGSTLSFGPGNGAILYAKFDAAGGYVFSRTIGGVTLDVNYAIINTSDGGYGLIGHTDEAADHDLLFIKFDDVWEHDWTRKLDVDGQTWGWSIIQTTNGWYAAAGHFRASEGEDYDALITRFNSTGLTCSDTSANLPITNWILPTVTTVTPTISSPGISVTDAVIPIATWSPPVSILCRKPFICADADADWKINIIDVSFIIGYLYKGGVAPVPPESSDVDGSGIINILDVGYLISYLYKGGPLPICL